MEAKKEHKVKEEKTTEDESAVDGPLFGDKVSSEFSFAAIAAKSTPETFGYGSKSSKLLLLKHFNS